MIVQKLVKVGAIFQLQTTALCQDHFDKQPVGDNICAVADSGDPCELCLQERRVSDAEHEGRQVYWLGSLAKAAMAAKLEPYWFPVYIAGPMTGLPEHNKPAFFRMEHLLTRHGYHTLSPAHYNGEHTYEWYLEEDIKKVLQARAVVLLLGWKHSLGASVEYSVAQITGRGIFYEA